MSIEVLSSLRVFLEERPPRVLGASQHAFLSRVADDFEGYMTLASELATRCESLNRHNETLRALLCRINTRRAPVPIPPLPTIVDIDIAQPPAAPARDLAALFPLLTLTLDGGPHESR